MTAPVMTDAELDAAIIAASRELIAAVRASPRDQARIDAARASYTDLLGQRASRA